MDDDTTLDLTVVMPYDDRTNAVVDRAMEADYGPTDYAALALACLELAGLDRIDFKLVRDMVTSHVEMPVPSWAYETDDIIISR